MRLRQSQAMQEETHLIVLHIYPCHILFIVVIREYQNKEIEIGKEPQGAFIVFLQYKVCQFPIWFMSVAMRLVYTLRNTKTTGVHPLSKVDIFPTLHPPLAIHIELHLLRQMQIQWKSYGPNKVLEANLCHESFLCVDFAMFV